MRRVKVYKTTISPVEDGSCMGKWERKQDGEAWFHAWGCDSMECKTGVKNYSTAIVERDNGIVENVPVRNIEFKYRPDGSPLDAY